MRHVERMMVVLVGAIASASDAVFERERPASIELARRERGPDPIQEYSPFVDRRPKPTWDNDPVRNRHARKRQSKW